MLGNNLCQSRVNKKTVRHQENPAIQSAKSILVIPHSKPTRKGEKVIKTIRHCSIKVPSAQINTVLWKY